MSENVQNIKVIEFITDAMKNWKVEITAGGKNLAEVNIQRGVFQRDALLPLLFVMVMMPLTYIHWKCTGGGVINLYHKKRLTTLCTWTT